MKKLALVIVAVLFTAGAYAQDQGTFRGQAGLVYGDDTEVGLNLGVQYFVIDKLAFAPSYSYFFKDYFGVKFSSINLDGRYYFKESLYGLAGINILRVSGGGASASDSKIALGVGYDLDLSDGMKLNLQAKYADQIVIGAGVVFSF